MIASFAIHQSRTPDIASKSWSSSLVASASAADSPTGCASYPSIDEIFKRCATLFGRIPDVAICCSCG